MRSHASRSPFSGTPAVLPRAPRAYQPTNSAIAVATGANGAPPPPLLGGYIGKL
jgi:hypothetical protein